MSCVGSLGLSCLLAVEPELTAKQKPRIFEVPISYSGHDYSEGKKITWRDGLTALWAIGSVISVATLPIDHQVDTKSTPGILQSSIERAQWPPDRNREFEVERIVGCQLVRARE